MSYYRVVNTKHKAKHRRIKISIVVIITLLSLVSTAVYWYVVRTRPILISSAEANINSTTTMAINNAILDVVGIMVTYDDLVSIEKNSDNDIVMLTANTEVINTIARKMAVKVQEDIIALNDIGVRVPIGTLSGIPFFTGMGQDVRVEVTPISSVTCRFNSQFDSAGINQTLHKIVVEIDSSVEIIIPTLRRTITSSNSVLLCESIIIGNVPETYLSGVTIGTPQSS